MQTQVLRLEPDEFDVQELKGAAKILAEGGLVAFPTETVYGLGANALKPEAVMKIFEAKGRPSDNPLILHVAKREDVDKLVRSLPRQAEILMERFWPGPLTLIMPKSHHVPHVVSAGLDTVGIRMPDHTVALTLLGESGVPVAAPSANISGRPSPTTGDHVIRDMMGKIDVIIDSGPTGVGVESTVLDLTAYPPLILRPGGITLEALKEVLDEVKIYEGEGVAVPKSPGMKYRHYAPAANVIVVEGSGEAIPAEIQSIASRLTREGKKIGIMATYENIPFYDGKYFLKVMGSRGDLSTIAANLFSLLRLFDDEGVDFILVEGVPQRGLGFAIMNRLKRAAGGKVLQAGSGC